MVIHKFVSCFLTKPLNPHNKAAKILILPPKETPPTIICLKSPFLFNSSTASITSFTPTKFAFQDVNDVAISFEQLDNSLLRNSDELANKLGSLEFTYLDANGAGTGTQDDIRMVRIRLILISAGNSITIQSLARFRNI